MDAAMLDEALRVGTMRSGVETRLEYGFERQAKRTPEAVAVEHRGRSITYAELDDRANRIAHRLLAMGVGPECLVGICMARSFDLVAGVLGILKAGGAYLPLDPAYPEARLRYMIENSGARALLTDVPRDISSDFGGQVLDISESGAWASSPRTAVERPPTVDRGDGRSLAYVIYTSGSTGQPKGVMLEHTATRMMAWAANTYTRQELSRVVAASSICFDPSVFEIFGPLTSGGTVLLKEHPREPFLSGERPTMLNTVPSVLAELADAGQIPDSVLAINVGGEKLSIGLVHKLYARSSVERIFNHYGPTEATTCSTVAHVPATAASDPELGEPICDAVILILRDDGSPVVGDEDGEIHIAGPMLARGYVNDPQQTARSFIADPGNPGQRLYRTGDIGRWRGDSVEFVARKGDFIKLRGFRIAPGEIETHLLGLSGVRQAAVALASDPQGKERLVAYIAGDEVDGLTLADVRSRLGEWLPQHMLPDWLHKAEALPETMSGKIDRNALPALSEPPRPSSSPDELSPIARAAADVIAAELHISDVGFDDDYFELGGNSLASVNVALTLEQVLGRAISPALLAHAPTPRLLQEALENDPAAGDEPIVALQKHGVGIPIFCVPDVHGRPLSYISLARELVALQPLYGLTISPAVSDGSDMSMDAIMVRFMQAIGERKPEGPYMVLGYSFGGRFAHELACRLRLDGDDVGLVLVDAPNTGTRHSLGATWKWISAAWNRKRERYGLVETARAALKKRNAFGAYLVRKRSTTLPAWVPAAERGVARSFLKAAHDHVPRDFDGPAMIVSCHNQRYINRFLNVDGFIGWRRHLKGPTTRIVADVDHHAIVRPPFASELAVHLGTFAATVSAMCPVY
jgi:amino acid adenylation domain-containing protein